VVTEGLAIEVMSFLIAALIAGPLSRVLGDFVARAMFRSGLSFLFDPSGLVIWFVVSLALSAVASFVPRVERIPRAGARSPGV